MKNIELESETVRGEDKKVFQRRKTHDGVVNRRDRNDITAELCVAMSSISRLNYNSTARSLNLRSKSHITWLRTIEMGEIPKNPPRTIHELMVVSEEDLVKILNIYQLEIPKTRSEKIAILKNYLGFYEF